MNKNILCLLLFFTSSLLHAQPNITRSIYFKEKKCLGYENYMIRALQHSGGSIFGVSVFSKTTTNADSRLYKLNAQLDTVWRVNYGGSNNDDLRFIHELPNGHLLLSGKTESKDGDVPYGHTYSAGEIWLLEVDTMGIIIKGRTFGGSNGSDLANTMISSDGMIYMCGSTIANDYDFTHVNFGTFDSDAWIAKLDTAFNLIWVKVYTGNSDEGAADIQEVSSNRLIVSITTEATNIEMAGSQAKGQTDLLAIFIDTSSNEIWKKRYGGKGRDGGNYICIDTLSKYIYMVATSGSGDGDITYHTNTWSNLPFDTINYNTDVWILKIDTLGTILGSKVYGSIAGPNDDTIPFDAQLYEGNIWVASWVQGGDGDCDSNNDGSLMNSWIAIIDTGNVNLIGKYTIAGNYADYLMDFFYIDNVLTALGISTKDVVAFQGLNTFSCDTTMDFGFILKLGDAPLGINDITKSNHAEIFSLYPNPSDSKVNIQLNELYKTEKYTLSIYTLDGKKIFRKKGNAETESIDCSTWAKGTYYVTMELKNGLKQTKQFEKQ